MSDFCPDGYVPAQQAIAKALERWSPKQFNQFVVAMESQRTSRPEGHIEQAVQAFWWPQNPDEWRDIAIRTVHRLRSLLHQGQLHAYYFDNDGRHTAPRDFWATAQADDVLESGIYWPFGTRSRVHEARPNYQLFRLQSELDRLLSEETSKKRPFPRSKMPELVAALRKLADLPNRRAQHEALCELLEFREYKITDAIFREAARQLPRDPGRKSRRQS